MRICAAQIRATKGDIKNNVAKHLKFIKAAAQCAVDLIVFPELSLTGYEPDLAKELAFTESDLSLKVFQVLSNQHSMYIAVGLPIGTADLPRISMMVFHPMSTPRIYSKTFLHPDEEIYFSTGTNDFRVMDLAVMKVAPAICYELSVPHHASTVAKQGAELYLVSVAKSQAGVGLARDTLTNIASNHGMSVVMSNCVGETADFIAAGQSAVWSNEGKLLDQLGDSVEGMIVLDMDTMSVRQIPIVL